MSHGPRSSLSTRRFIGDETNEWPTANTTICCGIIGSTILTKHTIQSTIAAVNMSTFHLNGMSPVEASSSMQAPPSNNTDAFSAVMIVSDLWISRIQDRGCAKDSMPAATYRRSQIPGIGPKGHETFYYELTSTAIDLLKQMKSESDMGRGWNKIPKNATEAKVKLVQIILALRKEVDGKYALEQRMVIQKCSTMWGAARPANVLHHNDRIRIFGIIMSLPEYREVFARLVNGPAARNEIDDVRFHPKQIYQDIALAFNNDNIVLTLPPNAFDLQCIDEINPNDMSRIRITRDCKYLHCCFVFY